MLLQQLFLSFLLLTTAQCANIARQRLEEIESHKLLSPANEGRQRSKRSILSKLFIDYPTIITGHLLSTQLSSSNENEPMRLVSSVTKDRNTNALTFLPVNPTVTVTVESEHISDFISVALMPDMSTYDSINAAKNLYAYRNSGALVNPFRISVRVLPEKRCAIIASVAGYSGTWHVFITDHRRQILHGDICIPRRSLLTMRPGYSILIKQAVTTVSSNQLVTTVNS